MRNNDFSSFLDRNNIIVDNEFVDQIKDVEALGYPRESNEDRIGGFASGLHALRALPRLSRME